MSGNKPLVGDLKQAILSRLDFRSFYSKYLSNDDTLRQDSSDGWSNRVKCPIHGDRNTPNFFANLLTGSFKCQACGAGGSVFDFWLNRHNYNVKDKSNFRHALVALATECGIDIKDFEKTFKKSGGSNPALPPGATDKTSGEVRQEVIPGVAPPAPPAPRVNKADSHDKTNDPIPVSKVTEMQKALTRDHWSYLNKKRGLTKKTIEDLQIGWDTDAIIKVAETNEWSRGRYAIPIKNKKGEIRNIRLYSQAVEPQFKIINYVTDKGMPNERKYGLPPRLYMLDKLHANLAQYEHIVFCEGEWDCILLNQMLQDAGMASWLAMTGTHGANTFLAEWAEEAYGKHVYFCFDCDEPGKAAALDHINSHFLSGISSGKFLSVRLVELPMDGSKETKDLSDYFLKTDGTIDNLLQLFITTPEMIVGGLAQDEGTQTPVKVDNFISAIKDRRYIDQRVEVPISISGTTSKVYHAIRSYAVTRCPLMGKDDQQCCSTFNTERTIAYGHKLFIEACMERESNILKSIAQLACEKDENCKVTPIKKVVMEEYFAHQVVERWRAEENEQGQMQNSQELVQTSIYILQPPENISIEPQNYMAIGFIRTHPRTSIATLFVENLTAMEEDWKKFTVESPDNAHMLKTLRDDFSTEEILSDITHGVTKIYEMDEILMAVLLSYLTPLWINFNGNLQRGWTNIAIIGDSGTGKSKTYERFSDWVELGDLFSALTGSRTGLLYSIKRKNDEWHVGIGRYVLASGKILAVDETQEVQKSEIKEMAAAMDTGYLKIDRVASGGYSTMTRTLFLMNPKNLYNEAATVSDFTFGCDALRMCFDPMFIRRLDMALFTVGSRKHELYNQRNQQQGEINTTRLTSRMMKTLIYWAWTRRADQVIWQDEATTQCLNIATEMSKEYGDVDQVPLVNPQDFREKLARLSTAYAILSRSFSEDMESVVVKPEHIQAIANFLDRIYSMPACNLKQRSKFAHSRNTLEDYDKIRTAFESVIKQALNCSNPAYRQGDYFVRFLICLQTLSNFRKREIADQLNVGMDWVSKRIMILQGYHLIEIAKNGGYKVTRKFNLFMQRWLQIPDIEHVFSQVQERSGKQALEQADDPQAYEPHYYNNDPFADIYIPASKGSNERE